MEVIEETDIAGVQFCVCFKSDRKDEVSSIPVSAEVQKSLKGMIVETQREWSSMDGGWVRFEYAEQYPSKAKLRAEHTVEEFDKIRYLYGIENAPIETNLFDVKYDISYYLVIYTLNSGSRVVGVKQASQLKGLLSSRNRIVQIIDDSLILLDRDVLRLDKDFDFIIDDTFVYILHSTGFENIAAVDEKMLSRAREKALELHQRVSFVDFTGIADHAAKHKRSARLVAAIWSNKELDTLSAAKVKRWANRTEVEYTEVAGLITPSVGNEAALLQILDYRRYAMDIDSKGVKVFEALSRRRAKRPAKAKSEEEKSQKKGGKKIGSRMG